MYQLIHHIKLDAWWNSGYYGGGGGDGGAITITALLPLW